MPIRYTTDELRNQVFNKFKILKESVSNDGITCNLNIYFSTGTPHNIEGTYTYSDELGYHYVFTEKGKIRLHKITDDLFEITYWIFKDLIHCIASKYEGENRIEKQDFRRLLFAKELELFEIVGENYRKRFEIAVDEILKNYPYNENSH